MQAGPGRKTAATPWGVGVGEPLKRRFATRVPELTLVWESREMGI